MVKPPVVYMAGLLRTLGRRVEGGSWVWLADGAGQRLFYPPNVAGWDDERWLDTGTFRGRWAIANEALSKFAVEQKRGKKPPKVPFDAEKIVANAVYLLGTPAHPAGDAQRRSCASRARRSSDADEDWKKRRLPAARPQRRAPAARRVPRPPGRLMGCCREHTRSELMRRGVASAGRGLPAIEPGMPTPAGTGLDRRSFLARSLGLAIAVYGGASLEPRGVRGGDRSRAGGRQRRRARCS